ncbi:hypothetical protein ACH42_17445 [Endozoicomonas sp. (ex Bugula neritina AB1)]|nr:hypothetical protein ACH42_17445 [Endozoicomonas sp. (ex Bugula neritina AB1)]
MTLIFFLDITTDVELHFNIEIPAGCLALMVSMRYSHSILNYLISNHYSLLMSEIKVGDNEIVLLDCLLNNAAKDSKDGSIFRMLVENTPYYLFNRVFMTNNIKSTLAEFIVLAAAGTSSYSDILAGIPDDALDRNVTFESEAGKLSGYAMVFAISSEGSATIEKFVERTGSNVFKERYKDEDIDATVAQVAFIRAVEYGNIEAVQFLWGHVDYFLNRNMMYEEDSASLGVCRTYNILRKEGSITPQLPA